MTEGLCNKTNATIEATIAAMELFMIALEMAELREREHKTANRYKFLTGKEWMVEK